jgi:hypothetical protein
MRNSKSFKSVGVLKTLYSAFVRSGLEYASTVWAPYYLYAKAGLERVQRRFLKQLLYKVEGHYPPRGSDQIGLLRQFCLVSLQCRRNVADVKFLCKLIVGEVDCPELLEKISFRVPRHNSRENLISYCHSGRRIL